MTKNRISGDSGGTPPVPKNSPPVPKNGAAVEPNPSELTADQKRHPITQEAWVAVQLFSERQKNKALRAALIKKDESLLQKDQLLLVMRKRLLDSDARDAQRSDAEADAENIKLQAAHEFVVDEREYNIDATTGAAFWTKPVKKPAK